MKYVISLLFLCHLSATPLKVPTYFYKSVENTRDNPGLAPFIGHLSFRNICDHIIDQSTEWFDPDTVHQGDTIYLNIWYLHWFTDKVHDRIKNPYILVSGDVGAWYPHPEIKKFLYDPKLAAWFCRNLVFSYHPKLFQIPMGQDLHLFITSPLAVDALNLAHEKKPSYSKEHLLYMNFWPREHGDRDKIVKLFENKPFCFSAEQNTNQNKENFYKQLASSKFVLSPLGLETDCVRTWEAVVFDSIPIVEHSFLDPLYEGLPILIIDDWTKIDEPFLEEKYEELKDLNKDKAYFDYWEKLIKNTQQKVRNNDLDFTQLEATLFSEEEIETIDSIIKDRASPLIYKGFLSTLRPLQLSNHTNLTINLYDAYLDQNIFNNLWTKNNLINFVSLISTEEEFSKKITVENPVTVFLDLTYYRTSLKLNFQSSVIHMGNFRYSLKLDFEDLYDDLQPGSLLFGNMAHEPYVEKVLDQFAKESGVHIERNGPFWSLIKQKTIVPLQKLFPEPYSAMREKALPFQISKWYSHGHIFDRLITDRSLKNLVLIGSSLGATPLHLAEQVPCGGKVFAVDSWADENQFQQFLSNVIHTALTDYVIPVRMDPLRAPKAIKKLDLPIDMIYLDALKEYFPTYQALQAWLPFVKKGALICGDSWNIPDVQRAIIQFALENNQIIHNEGVFWMFL